MPDALDILRTAKLLIREHGEGAAIQATSKVDEMLERGDLDGQRVWRRILKAIDELQAKESPDGAAVH